MELYSIMPSFTDHIDEICDDIEMQYKKGIANCALFMMKLVPEGNPPIKKAAICGKQYDLFRDRLAKKKAECGILVQCTIGHGYKLDQMFPFQRMVGFSNGEELNIVCPYDEGFRAYIRSEFHEVTSHRPKTIMVDDDFRLIAHLESGCCCPLHLAEINRRAGTNYTREELWVKVHEDTEEGRRLHDIFVDTQGESLIGAAKAMRAGIDEVDPKMPASFCGCGDDIEFADDIARVLAGKGNPVIVRINNGNYTPIGAKNITLNFGHAARQIAIMDGKADVFLAETDTCPQNRYSTSAHSMHTQFVGSILEGVTGTKHWITRLRTFESNAGNAYRDILSRYAGYYNALTEIVPTLSPVGARMPLSGRREFPLEGWFSHVSPWANCVFERLGLPMYFGKKPGGTVCMDGKEDAFYTDDEIRDILSHNVFLSFDSAKRLIRRGFGDCIGMDVRPWNGPNMSGEVLSDGVHEMNAQMEAEEIVPLSDSVRAESYVYHIPDGESKVRLFPGVATYHNDRGGNVTVFSGTPRANFVYYEAFSFLNESRKNQLIRLMKENGDLPIYYPGDAEVYLRAARMPDGTLFAAFFNIGLDLIENITFMTEKPITAIEYLTEEGKREKVEFVSEKTENGYCHTLKRPAVTLTPEILFLHE